MPMTRCFFCRIKIGKRKKGFLKYEAIYAKSPEHGYIVCVDCFEALESSIHKIRVRIINDRMAEMARDSNGQL